MAALHLATAFFWREIKLVKSNGIKVKEQKRVRDEATIVEKFKRRKPPEKPRKEKK